MRTTILIAALLALGSGGARAEDQPPKAPATPATMNDNLRPKFVAQAPDDMVASKMIGTSITNKSNETIGRIEDFVIDPKGGVKSWIVGVGGFLGMGTKYVAIDPSALTLSHDDKKLKAVIDTTKDQLQAAPKYVYLGQEQPKD